MIHSYGGETIDIVVEKHQAVDPEQVLKAVKENSGIGAIAEVTLQTFESKAEEALSILESGGKEEQ